MQTIQINSPGDTILMDMPQPVIQSDDVLVKVLYAGFCGSDLNTYLGKNALAKMPVIPGHEVGGVIENISYHAIADRRSALSAMTNPDFVTSTTLAPGMPCTINPYTACGACSSCRNDRPNACRFNQTLGVQRDGAMCEYIAVPASKVIADKDLTPKEFCLVEPVSVGFHAVSRGEVTARDTVMVLGCGMIGVGAIVNASQRGAQVIAVDIDDNKLSIAKQLGATYTINSMAENVHERLQMITGDSGPDVVIEAVGSPATYQMAVNEVNFTGRVVCIGYAKEPVTFETKYFVQKELDIRGSRNAMPEDFHSVIDYMKRGTFPIDLLISGIYKPEQVNEVFNHWITERASVFRLLIEFD